MTGMGFTHGNGIETQDVEGFGLGSRLRSGPGALDCCFYPTSLMAGLKLDGKPGVLWHWKERRALIVLMSNGICYCH